MPDWIARLNRRKDLLDAVGDRRARMVRELADHLEDLYQDAVRLGATVQQAEQQALRSLGHEDPATSGTRPRRGQLTARPPEYKRSRWTTMVDAGRDFRFALRAIVRRPVFAGVVVLVLALGIGANTAVFSVLNGVILEPLPYEKPSELVRLYSAS